MRQASPKAGYDVLGANRELAGAEVELVGLERRDKRLRAALPRPSGDYDFVLIDCPPSLSLLTLNGLTSAHGVIVPMQCEYFALEGLSDLVNTIKQVHANLNPALEVIGLLRVMFDAAHHAAAPGQRAAEDALRRQGLRHRHSSQRALGGGTELRAAGPRLRSNLEGRARISGVRPRAGRARRCHAHRRGSMNVSAPPVPRFDQGILARIEDAGINASAPRQQRWVDGWLVRLSPGKAKRARCIQAVAAGRLDIDAKLALCLPLFAAAGLRAYVRITPFSVAEGLDAHLATLGMERIDDTKVMVLASLRGLAARRDNGTPERLRTILADAAEFAEWIGAQRGSTSVERQAHIERLAQAAVPHQAVLLRDEQGGVVAGGQLVVEGAVAGLYDVFTAPARAAWSCRTPVPAHAGVGGLAGCERRLPSGRRREPRRRARLMRRLGFLDGYAYHYRSPPERAA